MNNEELNTVIHAPNRLQICALLNTSAELEFKLIKEQLNVSDSVLSKHLKVLEEAAYITAIKRSEVGRQRTWLSLTTLGRKAFTDHVNALQKIVGSVPSVS